MQFGIREICDVVFKAKNAGTLGTMPYVAGQPVLYIDTAKTSTMEGAATTVYAQGGKGNARLIAWEGERTLTFTVEDALLSELGFAILSGAGLIKAGAGEGEEIHTHRTSMAEVAKVGDKYVIDLSHVLADEGEKIADAAPVFAMLMEHGSIVGTLTQLTISADGMVLEGAPEDKLGATVLVDYYVAKTSGVTEMTIDVENFAGYYYVEASTLFRRQSDGKDLPAELIFPNVKIQSNFTFSMAATGDPSTFTFTMDAMPGYTRFDRKKKVLCAMQVIDEEAANIDKVGDSTRTLADANKKYPLTATEDVTDNFPHPAETAGE
jgi:hypothetical protein